MKAGGIAHEALPLTEALHLEVANGRLSDHFRILKHPGKPGRGNCIEVAGDVGASHGDNNTRPAAQLHAPCAKLGRPLLSRAVPKPRFQAVFFDFGGTLFSYRELTGRPFSPVENAIQRLGVEMPVREVSRAYWKASDEIFRSYTDRRYYLHRDLFRDTLVRFCEMIDASPDDEFLDEALENQRVFMLDNFRLREDCLSTLEQLRGAGMVLSIVSNIDDDYLHDMVERADLREVLHHWSSSEEAQSCKPDRGFFEHALEKAGVEAEDVLFVGDSPAHDIAGARAMGMTTALIRDDENPIAMGDTEPHHRIRQLSELLTIAGVANERGREE